jgi:hypothetical protein
MSDAKKGEVIHGELEHLDANGELMFDMSWNWYMGNNNAEANMVLRDAITALVDKSKDWSDAKNAQGEAVPKGAIR